MGEIIPIIIGAIPAGIQLEQFIQSLIEHQNALQTPGRPDVSDAEMQFTGQLLAAAQAKLIADAAKQA